MKIEAEVTKCSVCDGTGRVDISSHDCWGKPEWHSRCCRSCGGNGFVLDPVLVKYIKRIIEAK